MKAVQLHVLIRNFYFIFELRSIVCILTAQSSSDAKCTYVEFPPHPHQTQCFGFVS